MRRRRPSVLDPFAERRGNALKGSSEEINTEDYPHPIEKVWAAPIDPAAMADWLITNDFEPKVGFKVRCPPKPGSRGRFDCVVFQLAPPTKMMWSWKGTDEGEPTRVEFHLDRIVKRDTAEAHSQGRH